MRARPVDSADTPTATATAARWRITETRPQCFEEDERDTAKPIPSHVFSDSPLDQCTAAARQLTIPRSPRLLTPNSQLTTQRRSDKRLTRLTRLPYLPVRESEQSIRPPTPPQRPPRVRGPRAP